MTRQAVSRTLLAALAISLALHLGLLSEIRQWWTRPADPEPVASIEASLIPAPAGAATAKPSDPPEPPGPRPAVPEPAAPEPGEAASRPGGQPAPPADPAPVGARDLEAPQPKVMAAAAAETPVHALDSPAPKPETVDSPPPPGQASAAVQAPAQPAPPARPVQRHLPARIDIVYRVLAGENQFHLGQATYAWRQRNGHYTLDSVAEASGLAALFISGRMLQHSEGAIGEAGLRPEHYWLQRKERRQHVARFNWNEGRITLGGQQSALPLPEVSQDLLGFPFHLALTARESEPGFSLGITNGRKIQEYRFSNLGLERLDIQGLSKQALHLQGSRAGEGNLDVWLDSRDTWLPLKIRTLDNKGEVMMLVAESIGGG